MPKEKRTTTSWSESGKRYSKLSRNLDTDVLVIGGGMAGVLTAYTLARSGKRVVLLEAKRLGSGATELTTAFLTAYIDTEFVELEKLFGRTRNATVWQTHTEGINYIEHVAKEEKIDCDFTRLSGYIVAKTESEYARLEKEQRALRRAGAPAALSRFAHPDFANRGFIELPHQAKFHPLKFLQGVAAAATHLGALLYEQSEVDKLYKWDDGYVATVGKRRVWTKDVIVSTYLPFNIQPKLKFKKGKYISYVLELQVARGAIAEGLYEDCENPYHYVRVDAGKRFDRVIVGGEDHRSEIKLSPQKNFRALEQHFKQLCPDLRYKIVRKWRGPIIESVDGLAFIGKTKPHQYVATGFSGNGMTYSAISALLFTDLLTDKNRARSRAWAKLYNPTRIPSAKQLAYKTRDYLDELVGGALKNSMLKSPHAKRISTQEDDAKPAR